MVNKSTGFKEGQGKEGELLEWQASCRSSEETQEPKPETKCFYQGNGHWQRNCLKYLVDKKAGNFNKSIFDICVIDVYLTSTPSSTWVLDTGSVANIGNSKQKLRNKQRLAKGEVTMCVGSVSKDDMITIARSLYLRDQY